MDILKLQRLLSFLQVEDLHAAVRKPNAYFIVVFHEGDRTEVISWGLGLENLTDFASAA